MISSSYTAAAATATTIDEAVAYIAAEPVLRGIKDSVLAVVAAGKDTERLCRQLGLGAIPIDKVAILAGSEIGRRKQLAETLKWVVGAMVTVLVALIGALVVLSKT